MQELEHQHSQVGLLQILAYIQLAGPSGKLIPHGTNFPCFAVLQVDMLAPLQVPQSCLRMRLHP
jgi:hypothetical protein